MKFVVTDIITLHREVEVPEYCPACRADLREKNIFELRSYQEGSWQATYTDEGFYRRDTNNQKPDGAHDLAGVSGYRGGSELKCACGCSLIAHKYLPIPRKKGDVRSKTHKRQSLRAIKYIRDQMLEEDEE